jgi:hypothetical protein
MMRTEDDKARTEIAVFREFATRCQLPIVQDSIRKGDPNSSEPDILCELDSGGPLAYELAEACAPEFASAQTRALKTGVEFTWGNDVSDKTVLSKIQKRYGVDCPVELLIYTNGRTALPEDAIAARIELVIQEHGQGQFERTWLMADHIIELLPNRRQRP